MPSVETRDGVRLHVDDWGRGRPIVLIHGWPLYAAMWEYQSVPLARAGFRVVAYDRRGFGRSDQPYEGYDYDTLADDLHAVLDGLGLSDVTLVGFSMGGGEVARYLSRHGTKRIRNVALIGAVTPGMLRSRDNPDGVDRSVFDGLIAEIEADRPAFLTRFGKAFYGQGILAHAVSSEILQWHQGMALPASPAATIACVQAFGLTDFRPDVAAFTVPTLIIHGSADVIVPPDPAGRRLATLLPQATYLEYDGAPHGLFVTARERLAMDLLELARR